MISIELDRERHLLRTFRGMKLFEDKTNKSMLKGFEVEDCKIDDFIALLWSLLIHEDKTLTVEQVEGMIDQIDAGEIIAKIAEALKS